MLSLLNKNTIIMALIAALLGAAIWVYSSWRSTLRENERLEQNYQSALSVIEQEKHQEMAEFRFKSNKELKEFISMNNDQIRGLEDKLEQNAIKLNRIQKIVATKIVARDTFINNIDLGDLASKYEEQKPFSIAFTDSTKCFFTKMKLIYADGKSYVQVLDRKYNDNIYDVTTWERRQWKILGLIPTRLFGKKIYKTQLISDCGETKTIILNKE